MIRQPRSACLRRNSWGRRPHALGILTVLTIVVWAVLDERGRSDEPVTGAAPFTGPIVRILQKKCVACHAAGNLAVPLETYHDVRPWARAIREEILEHRMPPWPAVLSSRPFANELRLTVREMALLVAWIDGGTPRGDDKDLPARRAAVTWARGTPDLIVPLPEVRVAADAGPAVAWVTVPLKLPGVRWLTGLDYRPGDRRVVRSGFVYVSERGLRESRWLGAWTPWYGTTALPPETGRRLLPESTLQIALHVRGVAEPVVERGTLALYLANRRALEMRDVVVEPGCMRRPSAGCAEWQGETSVDTDVMVSAVHVAGGAALEPIEVTARHPNGAVEVLAWIEQPGGWPTPFVFQEPVRLARGTRVTVRARSEPAGSPTGAMPALLSRDDLSGFRVSASSRGWSAKPPSSFRVIVSGYPAR